MLGVLGALLPVGTRGRAPVGGSGGARPLKLKAFVFGYPKGGAIIHLTSKFRKLCKPHISSDVGLTGHSDSH